MQDSDESEIPEETCPICCGKDTHFEIALRYWKCGDCESVWGVGLNKNYFHPVKYHKTSNETIQEDD